MNGAWQLAISMILSGTIGVFVTASGQPVWTIVFYRCLIGGGALLAWTVWSGQWKPMSRANLGWILAGGATLLVNWVCLFSAYSLSSISVATVVLHTQPFFLILLNAGIQREMPKARKLAWLSLAFVGVALASGFQIESTTALGVGLSLAAAFLYALSTLATRRVTGIAPGQIAGVQLMLGVATLFPFAALVPVPAPLQSWGCLILLGLLHTAVSYRLMYAGFLSLRPESIATLSFIYPAVAVVADLSIFGTTLNAAQYLGLALILAAVVANQRS